jgi:hypothetical protein
MNQFLLRPGNVAALLCSRERRPDAPPASISIGFSLCSLGDRGALLANRRGWCTGGRSNYELLSHVHGINFPPQRLDVASGLIERRANLIANRTGTADKSPSKHCISQADSKKHDNY